LGLRSLSKAGEFQMSKSYADSWSSAAFLCFLNLATGGLKRRGPGRLLLFSQVMKLRCSACYILGRLARSLPFIAGYVPGAARVSIPRPCLPAISSSIGILLRLSSSLSPERLAFSSAFSSLHLFIDWLFPRYRVYSRDWPPLHTIGFSSYFISSV